MSKEKLKEIVKRMDEKIVAVNEEIKDLKDMANIAERLESLKGKNRGEE